MKSFRQIYEALMVDEGTVHYHQNDLINFASDLKMVFPLADNKNCLNIIKDNAEKVANKTYTLDLETIEVELKDYLEEIGYDISGNNQDEKTGNSRLWAVIRIYRYIPDKDDNYDEYFDPEWAQRQLQFAKKKGGILRKRKADTSRSIDKNLDGIKFKFKAGDKAMKKYGGEIEILGIDTDTSKRRKSPIYFARNVGSKEKFVVAQSILSKV